MNSFPIVLSVEAKRKTVPSGEDNNKRIEYSLVNFWDILIMTLLSVLCDDDLIVLVDFSESKQQNKFEIYTT
jgi:hypothetical protein